MDLQPKNKIKFILNLILDYQMTIDNIIENYGVFLSDLRDKNRISSEQFLHLQNRGLTVIRPEEKLGLENLGKIFPEIVIGASPEYIKKMKVPYQASSFIAAKLSKKDDSYVYKIPRMKNGGVLMLTGGKRNFGDNLFSAIHRIIIGYKAIIVSADNMIINRKHILDWNFFGKHIEKRYPKIYQDLSIMHEKYSDKKNLSYVIVARSENTFRRLRIHEHYQKNEIEIMNSSNNINTIFITNNEGYKYANKIIKESDQIKYIVTGDNFDILNGMKTLRKEHNIDMILNDGGRIMSNGFRQAGILCEERVTLEPEISKETYELIIKNNKKIYSQCILGKKGLGIDKSEIKGGILISSTRIGNEKANVYVYPLEDKVIM